MQPFPPPRRIPHHPTNVAHHSQKGKLTKMNLTTFLKNVDDYLHQSDKEQLSLVIHELARIYPEAERDQFLALMVRSLREAPDSETCSPHPQQLYSEADVEEVIDSLDLIESGDIALDGVYNYEYDDWYNSSVDEILYEDPDEIIPLLNDAFSLAHKCYDTEDYENACDIFSRLIQLEIFTAGDYSSGTIPLEELCRRKMVAFDYSNLMREAVISAYMYYPREERPAAIYDLLKCSEFTSITLESVFQYSPVELPEIQEFLKAFVLLLGNISGRQEEKLIREAVSLLNDRDAVLMVAKAFSKNHPELYRDLLSNNQYGMSCEELFRLGLEAVEAVTAQTRIREEIALKTAEYALELDQSKAAEMLWIEAFRSHPSAENYLRICLEGNGFEEARPILRQVTDAFIGYEDLQQKTATVTDYTDYIRNPSLYGLWFFDGRLDDIFRYAMNTKNALGWSNTFMKTGIELLLLTLYPGKELPTGCQAMCRWAAEGLSFSADSYARGTKEKFAESDSMLFWRVFQEWRKMDLFPKDRDEEILKRLDQWIAFRVGAIMDSARRNYYGECAAFIAALGEVREARGEKGAKRQLMEKYRAANSRKRAFREELQKFGWRG